MKNVQKFIDLHKDAIADLLKGTGLFPSVLIAQLIQESSGAYGEYGFSYLAHKYHNYGGIKYWSGYTGDKVKMKTGEETKSGQKFTIYANFIVCKSFIDFVKWRVVFLTKNSRYKNFGVFSAATPELQIAALKNAGYATDTQYTARVSAHLRTYNLYQLDEVLKKKIIDIQINVLPPSASGKMEKLLKKYFSLKKLFIPVDSTITYIDESVKVDLQQ